MMDIKEKIQIWDKLSNLEQLLWDLYAVQRNKGMSDDHPEQVDLYRKIMNLQSRSRAINNVIRCTIDAMASEERDMKIKELRSKIFNITKCTDEQTRLMKRELFELQNCLNCTWFQYIYPSKRCQTPPICSSFE